MTPYQTQILMKVYEAQCYLVMEERQHLAQSLNISENKISNWFDERRKKQRRMGIFCGGE